MAVREKSVVEQLQNETECSICIETFEDPRILPCLHTFCFKCLKGHARSSRKQPGHNMPCPSCRADFLIPAQGMAGVKKDFNKKRLIELTLSSQKPSTSECSGVLCDSCSEDAQTATRIQSAEFHCVECRQNLCETCSRCHKRNRMTRHHNLVPVGKAEENKEPTRRFVPSVCDVHKKEHASYCEDCKEVLCLECRDQVCHQSHKKSEIDKIFVDFCKRVDSKTKEVTNVIQEVVRNKEKVEKEEMDFKATIEEAKNAVVKRSNELKQAVDQHEKSLLSHLESVQSNQLLKMESKKETLKRHITDLDLQLKHCNDTYAAMSAKEMCLAMNKFEDEVPKQKVMDDCRMSTHPSNLSFTGSDFNFELKNLGSIEATDGLYKNNPVLLRTIQSDEVEEDSDKYVTGIAILNEKLFIVHDNPGSYSRGSYIERYDGDDFSYEDNFYVSDLEQPFDMTSSSKSNSLYVFDDRNDDVGGDPCFIFNVDTDGEVVRKWSTGQCSGTLSISPDANRVVLTNTEKTRLKEYTLDGHLIRQVVIAGLGVSGLRHGLKLAANNDLFLVCYSCDDRNGVCKVAADGNSNKGRVVAECTQVVYDPQYLAVDANGSVFVVDENNRRVVILDSNLNFVRELVSRETCIAIRYPTGILLDETNGRLFVLDAYLDRRENTYSNGRVLVFDIKR